MASWYVKDFSALTGISVRMLRHYDEIGVLHPSARTDAGYRVYSAADLLQLQQVVALKSLGLSLKHIKELFAREIDAEALLKLQYKALKQQVASLQEAVKILRAIIRDGAQSESVEVETILQLMRVYNVKKDLKKTWVGKVANAEQLERVVDMAQRYPDDKYDTKLAWVERVFTKEERAELVAHFAQRDEQEVLANQKRWELLLGKIQAAIDNGVKASSKQGKALVEEVSGLLDDMYGNNSKLRAAVERAHINRNDPHPEMTVHIIDWLASASR